jgi:hypothetical protein
VPFGDATAYGLLAAIGGTGATAAVLSAALTVDGSRTTLSAPRCG